MPRVWSARIRSARSVAGRRRRRRLPAQLLAEVDQRAELVGLEDRRGALQDRREAVEAEAGVDVLRRQRRERRRRVLVVLHEDEVPVLQEALVLAAGQVVGAAELEPAVEVELRARAARAGRAGLPEVLRRAAARRCARAGRRPTATPRSPPRRGRAPSASSPSKTVTQMSLGVEAEALDRELPRELDGALLEVVADREVAEHLEEGQVARRSRPTWSMSTVRKHFWQVVSRWCGGCSWPRKYGFSGCMPARGEQRRRVVLRGHERRRRAGACGRAARRRRGSARGSRRLVMRRCQSGRLGWHSHRVDLHPRRLREPLDRACTRIHARGSRRRRPGSTPGSRRAPSARDRRRSTRRRHVWLVEQYRYHGRRSAAGSSRRAPGRTRPAPRPRTSRAASSAEETGLRAASVEHLGHAVLRLRA